MAKLPHSNSRRMYSWWWDSHISPKNSKWLQDNLTDMDAKVKSMIKLIEEDADSFARRAEMYYKKRPELMKMVEEFYRAYRALAERYDHATGALVQAHRTMTEAFPNQVPLGLTEDEVASSNENDLHTPDDQYSEDRKGLKQYKHSFGSGDDGKFGGRRVRRGLNFDEAGEKEDQSTQRVVKLEKEIQTLKEALSKFEAEKESSLAHYKQSLEKLSHQELEFSRVQEDSRKNLKEVESLNIALKVLEGEKETTLVQYQKCLERIKDMEGIMSHAQKHVSDINERAQKAEAEVQTLKLDLATMESEKTTSIDQCKQSLEKISALKNKLALAEDKAEKLNKRAEKAEIEAETLKIALAELGVEKEADSVQYQQCLDTISTLEKKISCAEEEIHMLNGEIESGVSKIKGAEEKCISLENLNQSLHSELESLSLKLGVQSDELKEKKHKIDILWTSIQEERLRFVEAETAFQTLHLMHARTEEELKSLNLELQTKAITISDLETHNQNLLNESLKIKEENKRLNDLNLASSVSIKDMQNEIISLSETKVKLEEEVVLQVDQRKAFQQEIYCLNQELNDLNKKYLALLNQVEAVGYNPECFQSVVKSLQDENLNLKESQDRQIIEKVDLLRKIENLEKVEEKNTLLEKSLSDLSSKLDDSREERLALENSFKSVSEEKSTLHMEKAAIETQLQVASEDLVKLLEKNAFMENSVSDAHDEIEGMKIQLKSLEDMCKVFEKEKSDFIRAKGTLVFQVEITTQRLEDLQNKYEMLEDKYSVLEKEKESALFEIEELRSKIKKNKQKEEKQTIEIENLHRKVLDMEKTSVTFQEENLKLLDERRSLVKDFRDLQQENTTLEGKNYLILGETASLSNLSLIFKSIINERSLEIEELRSNVENLQVDHSRKLENLEKIEEKNTLLEKSLSDLSSKLDDSMEERLALENSFKSVSEEKSTLHMEKAIIETQLHVASEDLVKLLEKNSFMENSVSDAHDEIEGMKILLKSLENMCQILEKEKSDFISEKGTLVFQVEITRQRLEDLENKYQGLEDKYSVLEKEKESALFEVEEMGLTIKKSKQKEEKQTIEIENLHGKVLDMQKISVTLQEENSKLLDKKMSLVKDFLDLQQQNNTLEGENYLILGETASLSNLSLIFKNIINERSLEIEELRSNVDKLQGDRIAFEDKINVMERKLEETQCENMDVKKLLENTEDNLSAITLVNGQLNSEIENGKNLFSQKETEISEVMCKIADTEKKNWELQNIVADLKEKNDEIKMLWDDANRKQNDEVSFWENEATKLTSELHTSSVVRTLLEVKFQEFTEVLKQLQEETNFKDRSVELLNERIGVLEGENREIGVQLAEYAPAINSLKDSISSLEDRTCFKQLQNKNHEEIKVTTANHFERHEATNADQKELDNLSALKDLNIRVKAVEKIVTETNSEVKARMRLLAELGSNGASNQENTKPLPINSESENGLLTKDMMLDQVSECSPYLTERKECTTTDITNVNENENITTGIDFNSGVKDEKESTTDKLANAKRFSLPNQDSDKSKILERLNSDCQKVTSLQITVQDLKRKVEMREKRIGDKFYSECESIEGQLVKAEEDITQLSDLNGKLMKHVDTSDDVKGVVESEESRNLRRKFSEQARKVSERIGKMQLEVQRIQFLMLKLENTNGEDNRRKSEVPERKRTSLHHYLGLRTSNRKKKRVFCGCVHPPSTAD